MLVYLIALSSEFLSARRYITTYLSRLSDSCHLSCLTKLRERDYDRGLLSLSSFSIILLYALLRRVFPAS